MKTLVAMAEGRIPTAPIITPSGVSDNLSRYGDTLRHGQFTIPPGSNLRGANFTYWPFVNAVFADVNLHRVNFHGADLQWAVFCQRDEDGSVRWANLTETNFDRATFSLDTDFRGMPFWQVQKFDLVYFKKGTLDRIRAMHGEEMAQKLAEYQVPPHEWGMRDTELSLPYDVFIQVMPEAIGIEVSPVLSEKYPDAYRANNAADVDALAWSMAGERIPRRTVDASGANLRDTSFEVGHNMYYVFDDADLRGVKMYTNGTKGVTIRVNNALMDSRYLSVFYWKYVTVEFETIRVELRADESEEVIEALRRYVPSAKPGDTVTLTRAQFGEFAKAQDVIGDIE